MEEKNETKSRKYKHITLKVSPKLHLFIETCAKMDMRSSNNWIKAQLVPIIRERYKFQGTKDEIY